PLNAHLHLQARRSRAMSLDYHLLAETFIGQDSESPDKLHRKSPLQRPLQQGHPTQSPQQLQPNKRRLSLISNGKFDRSSSEEPSEDKDSIPAQVYTISRENGMLGERESQRELAHHHHTHTQPLQSAGSTHNIGRQCRVGWQSHHSSQRSAVLRPRPPAATLERPQPQKLERMYSVDRVSDEAPSHGWFPKENMFTFQTATTTMQAPMGDPGPQNYREGDELVAHPVVFIFINRNFRKHLRMVGSRRTRAQTFADRREKSFSRSWSDPTPVKSDSLHDSRDSGDLQMSCDTLDEEFSPDWEAEREQEADCCEGDDFVPPKVMLISSKVPKAEYVPTIIRRDDSSIIPILYDHEHATFDDILDEIEKKLNVYRKGCKIWKMLIFCQGGPGHLYLLKNKVATFAKVEKEEDLIQFWKRLSRLMSKINPEPNVIHIMGCYILGNPNGEKLFQNLKNLMMPLNISFESPLELSAQGKQMIETYFDFRLYRLWKTRQHSKLLDYDDIL
uniref:NMDA receptor synaptonuclear signaling and neuronal migration factor b n=1 Tax=Erpetoichthys calabaricus TaxID=27687 RepID=A0A8C4T2F1_ERPCA